MKRNDKQILDETLKLIRNHQFDGTTSSKLSIYKVSKKVNTYRIRLKKIDDDNNNIISKEIKMFNDMYFRPEQVRERYYNKIKKEGKIDKEKVKEYKKKFFSKNPDYHKKYRDKTYQKIKAQRYEKLKEIVENPDREFKQVKGFQSRYKVSQDGIVCDFKKVRIVSTYLDDNGYERITLQNDKGEHKLTTVHRVVGMAFIPNPDNKPEINHIDGDKQNNHVSNLEWATRKENVKHKFDELGCESNLKGWNNKTKKTDYGNTNEKKESLSA